MNRAHDDQSAYAARRERLLATLPEGEAMLLFAAHHHLRNGDAEFRFRQLSDVLYLTGWEDPDAVVLLRPGADEPFVMWVQPKDEEREIWTGIRAGPVGAVERFGADAAFAVDELDKMLGERLVGVHTLHYAAATDAETDRRVLAAIAKVRRKARDAFDVVPDAFIHPSRVLHEMRLVKDDRELTLMREAARITCEAHVAAMKAAGDGVFEYELEALIDYTFRGQGGNGAGYTSIVGGGANACILHYITNREPLHGGDLCLIDAGCEYAWYTADVTRTFPVNGRFTEPQKELYQAVLDAQLAVIEASVPGARFWELHQLAIRKLTESMVALGLLEGEVDALIEDKSFKRYYMHGTSHWLGMEVHDVGSYVSGGESRAMEPGMVFTIEPGLYVAPDDEAAPERFRGLGIRIEDDILITEDGHEVLTAACPKTIEEVEAACQG
ncbi:MAG: M24 family metallopeptidase [Proteobacteria bacterium]|nr:M24 family metallopeptidase [Pseudomonadota bacterium]MCP4919343.1 M24 family metallopeptidase [Pseudomonadota bacterium]